MKLMLLATALGVILSGAAAPAIAQTGNPVGFWRTKDGSAVIEVAPCGETLCGRIASLSDRSVQRDNRNRDPASGRAEIIGAGMFGLHDFPDDPNWRGWWGDEPPFRVPVFVLTHKPRPSIEMAGGTTFHFLGTTITEALRQAVAAAGGKDVRIGGGARLVRDFLKAGLVDRLHVAIAPILLGRGVRLWDDMRGLETGYSVTAETAPSGTIHLTFQR